MTKFHGDSVQNKSARTQKLQRGAERPPPNLFRVQGAPFTYFRSTYPACLFYNSVCSRLLDDQMDMDSVGSVDLTANLSMRSIDYLQV